MLHRCGSVAPSGRCALAQEQLQPLWYHCYEAAVVGAAFRRLVRSAAWPAGFGGAAYQDAQGHSGHCGTTNSGA
jgi:hypothetical protein